MLQLSPLNNCCHIVTDSLWVVKVMLVLKAVPRSLIGNTDSHSQGPDVDMVKAQSNFVSPGQGSDFC